MPPAHAHQELPLEVLQVHHLLALPEAEDKDFTTIIQEGTSGDVPSFFVISDCFLPIRTSFGYLDPT